MATKKLRGKDGKLNTFSLGTAITTGGLTTAGYYAINTVGATSGLPTGAKVGYILYTKAESGNIITLGTGDSVSLMTVTERCDLRAGNIESTNEEIDMTTLCDVTKTYASGFSDAQGSFEGITTIGISETFINKFFPIATQSADGSTITISEVNGDPLLLMLEVNKESTVGEPTAMYVAPITMLSYNAGAQVEGEQAFTSDFRVAANSSIVPHFFKIEQA